VRHQGHDFCFHLLQFPLFRYIGERGDNPHDGAAVFTVLANGGESQNEMFLLTNPRKWFPALPWLGRPAAFRVFQALSFRVDLNAP